MLATTLSACAGFAFFFVYASVFEYAFHRWVLHHPWRVFPYPYRIHALLHHRIFHGDTTYCVQREEDRELILFKWWQAALLLLGNAPVMLGLQVASGLPLFWPGLAALGTYYVIYEYLHCSMHNPSGRWIERTGLFRFLNSHHRLHHGHWRVNFNVVLPVGDRIFRTLRQPVRRAVR